MALGSPYIHPALDVERRRYYLARPPPVKGPLRRYAPLTDSSRPKNPASIEEDAPTGSDVLKSQTSCVAISSQVTLATWSEKGIPTACAARTDYGIPVLGRQVAVHQSPELFELQAALVGHALAEIVTYCVRASNCSGT